MPAEKTGATVPPAAPGAPEVSGAPVRQTVTLDDVYTRKIGGETYAYTLRYTLQETVDATPAARVDWQADVYKDGELKGRPGGTLLDTPLSGMALRQSMITLVEITIENMLGIEE